jgi:hypothetical protein
MLSSLTLTEKVRKLAEYTKDKKLVAGSTAKELGARTLKHRSLDSPPVPTSKDVAGGDVVLSKRPVSATSESSTTSLVPALLVKEESPSSLTLTFASARTVSVTVLNTLT